MIGLEGTRVVILDDVEEEAIPVLYVLARMGIGASYYNPTLGMDLFPDRPLSGVRLAILDMDLVGGGVDSKTKVSALLGHIKRLISPENGPYSVIVWTAHPDLQELFEKSLFSSDDTPRPNSVLRITKEEVGLPGRVDPDALLRRMLECLSASAPLVILRTWEQECHVAASDVLLALSKIVDPGRGLDRTEWRGIWEADMLRTLKALAKAEAGQTLDAETSIPSLHAALTPLFVDRLEIAAGTGQVERRIAQQLVDADEQLDLDRKSKLTAMVHLAHDRTRNPTAGSMYLFGESDELPAGLPSFESVVADLLSPSAPAELGERVRQETRLVVVEISPLCDHAQRKLRSLRLITGLMVPESLSAHFKRPTSDVSFLWELKALHIEAGGLSGTYRLILSARHQAHAPLESFGGSEAFARLRVQALSHLQSWIGFYTSRPAITSL